MAKKSPSTWSVVVLSSSILPATGSGNTYGPVDPPKETKAAAGSINVSAVSLKSSVKTSEAPGLAVYCIASDRGTINAATWSSVARQAVKEHSPSCVVLLPKSTNFIAEDWSNTLRGRFPKWDVRVLSVLVHNHT